MVLNSSIEHINNNILDITLNAEFAPKPTAAYISSNTL